MLLLILDVLFQNDTDEPCSPQYDRIMLEKETSRTIFTSNLFGKLSMFQIVAPHLQQVTIKTHFFLENGKRFLAKSFKVFNNFFEMEAIEILSFISQRIKLPLSNHGRYKSSV